MKPRWQGILILIVVVIVLVLATPQTEKPDVLINQDISISSLASSPEIGPDSQPALKVKTYSALAKEISGSVVFYELNPDRRWPLASLTKLMAALVALERIPANDARDELIKRMLIISDNQAAEQLAQIVGQERFVEKMNAQALTLQMEQTSFFDPSGLSFLNQSTVHDLYQLVNYIAQRQPQILEWSRQLNIVVEGTTRPNINKFAGRPDFQGGKTGWTEEANGNLISVFSGPNKALAIIILGAPDKIERFAQTENLLKWISQSSKP